VIVTGSHPEYWTRAGLDALEGYAHAGGRIMYLGGNGFYWVTSRVAAKPWIIEVRRDNSGTRCWDAPYGERIHVATTEAGGMWRTRGRAPNKLLGVGFASEGWSKGCGYRRLEASYHSPAAKFFEGVDEAVVGDYGFVLGGAVGDEVDRYDISLGSPEHAYVLATSTGLGNEYQLVIEDMTLSPPGPGRRAAARHGAGGHGHDPVRRRWLRVLRRVHHLCGRSGLEWLRQRVVPADRERVARLCLARPGAVATDASRIQAAAGSRVNRTSTSTRLWELGMEVEAYFEDWSRLPGEIVRMAISTRHPEVRATLEKITRGPTTADAAEGTHAFGRQVPGIDIVVPGRKQDTALGSYADLPLGLSVEKAGFSVHLWFQASVPGWVAYQVILGCGRPDHEQWLTVGIQGKRLVVDTGGTSHQLNATVDAHIWYSLVLSVEDVGDNGKATVDLARVTGYHAAAPRYIEAADLITACPPVTQLRLAAASADDIGSAEHGFNGRIEDPTFFHRVLTDFERTALHENSSDLPAADRKWLFTKDLNSRHIPEAEGRAPHAVVRNGAERGVTGHNWTGAYDSFLEAPDQYAAIYFHSDELIDANWDYNLQFELPPDLESGVYAVRLRVAGHEDRYPLFVRGKVADRVDVLFIVPTDTYLAYANDRFAGADLSGIMGHKKVVSADEKYLNEHPEFGKSCYDVHADGSPVRYSSRRRPLVNVRPHYPNWLTGSFRHFAVDLFLIEWLERSEFTYHVATDEDVDLQGQNLLARYKVVVTGSHPEYWTNRALTALENYLSGSGHMMYLGGDGFNWVTSRDPDRPWVVEIRRDNAGLRAWNAPPGERTHVQTGEPGGLWRYRGRGPHKTCGVGFATEGFSKGRGYRRHPISYQEPVSAFFEGIEDDIIGDFGFIPGGAAGDECDRFDLRLGSPPQTQILASAWGFGPEYLVVNEDMTIPMPNLNGPGRPDMVRSDMVYIPIFGGGGVFSAASIAFAGAIAWNGFNNNVVTLANNVLRRFVQTSTLNG
jgi:N,N-dimethylformamidase